MTDREELQRERGLCSSPDCSEPIAGWCATCDATGPFKAPKLCRIHLHSHVILMGWLHHQGHEPHWLYEPAQGGGR